VKVLVLGGTLFLGRHVVEAALKRRDEVTIFNRGCTNPGLFRDVEELHGDRDSCDLAALEERQFDAVVDTSARIPRWVREVGAEFDGRAAHYTFISSASVYVNPSRPEFDESAPVHTLSDPTSEEIVDAATYGALKALGERAAEESFPRSLSVRAGLMVGPYDDSGRFTYWVHRIARGGDVLCPEPRDQAVQFIHARDLAEWILAMAERGETGVFNASGPAEPLTFDGLLEACRRTTGADTRLHWVHEPFLLERGVEAWSDLPLWLAPGANPDQAAFLEMNVGKAIEAGLRFRPLKQTIRETLSDALPKPEAGLSPEREAQLLLEAA
jgi:2'-hydroxyisoflavone reductase